MLHAIAKSLGFRIEQLEIFEGGYTSVGWGSAFDQEAAIRQFLFEIASGQRSFPVTWTEDDAVTADEDAGDQQEAENIAQDPATDYDGSLTQPLTHDHLTRPRE